MTAAPMMWELPRPEEEQAAAGWEEALGEREGGEGGCRLSGVRVDVLFFQIHEQWDSATSYGIWLMARTCYTSKASWDSL